MKGEPGFTKSEGVSGDDTKDKEKLRSSGKEMVPVGHNESPPQKRRRWTCSASKQEESLNKNARHGSTNGTATTPRNS